MMLSPLDQLLVPGTLLRRELCIDLGAHPRLDGIEAGPDLRPQRIRLGTVAREDHAHRVPLRVAQIELAAQIRDHRVGAAAAQPAIFVALRRFAAAPSGESARKKYRSKQTDGGEFGSIQRDSSFSY
jgi:hypothetical protein